MDRTVLIVEPDAEQASQMRDALLQDGRVVQVAHTFQAAGQMLAQGGVAVLVTAVRLAAFNGLHLIIRTRALHPHTRCIAVGLPADRSRDTDNLGITFLQKPIDAATIAAAVSKEIELAAAMPQRRWPRKPVHLAGVLSGSEIDILDIGYGGLRFQGGRTPVSVGSELTVNVPSLGVSVIAVARWTKPLHMGSESWCGAEIIDPPAGTISNWTGVVDSVT